MRVFIDNNGMWYKAKEPKESSHAERSLVTVEFLAVLPEDSTPMHMVDIDAAIAKYVAQKNR
jgi:hypothetical protein